MNWYKKYEHLLDLCKEEKSLSQFLAKIENHSELVRFCELLLLFYKENSRKNRELLVDFVSLHLKSATMQKNTIIAILISSSFAARCKHFWQQQEDNHNYPPRLRIWIQNVKIRKKVKKKNK